MSEEDVKANSQKEQDNPEPNESPKKLESSRKSIQEFKEDESNQPKKPIIPSLQTTSKRSIKSSKSSRPSSAKRRSLIGSRPSSAKKRNEEIYNIGDIVLTQNGLGIIRTVRGNENVGFRFGLTIPGTKNQNQLHYIPKEDIVRKVKSEDVLSRVTMLTKALEEHNNDIQLKERQLNELKKELDNGLENNIKLKQNLSDLTSKNSQYNIEIKQLKQEMKNLKRENKQQANDMKTLKQKTPTTIGYQKQVTDLRKDNNKLKKIISKLEKDIINYKTKLSQQRLKYQKNLEINDQKKENDVIKLRKDVDKLKRIKIVLEKENLILKKKINANEKKRGSRRSSIESQTAEQQRQLAKKAQRMRDEIVKVKKREQELDALIKKQQVQNKLLKNDVKKNELDKLDELEMNKKKLMAERRHARAEADRLRLQQEELERQKKNLKKNKTIVIDNKIAYRNYSNKTQKPKVIIHKKYLTKDYIQTVTKWRVKPDKLKSFGNKIVNYQDKIKKFNESKDEKEYESAKQEMEDIENELDDDLDELMSNSDLLNELALKDEEIEELHDEINRLENELKNKQEMKIFFEKKDINPQESLEELRSMVSKLSDDLKDDKLGLLKLSYEYNEEEEMKEFKPDINEIEDEFEELNEKEDEEIDDELEKLMDVCKNHSQLVKGKNENMNDKIKQIGLLKSNLSNCESILGVLQTQFPENELKEENEDLNEYKKQLNKAMENIEDMKEKLYDDGKRTKDVIDKLHELRLSLANKKLKYNSKQNNVKPDALKIKDLRSKIKELNRQIENDRDVIKNINDELEEYNNEKDDIQDKLQNILQNLHIHNRKPKEKLLDLMNEYNKDLDNISNKLRKKRDELDELNSNMDDKKYQEKCLQKEYAIQKFLFEQLEEKDECELQDLMTQMSELLDKTENNNDENNNEIQKEKLNAFKILDDLKLIKQNIIDKIKNESENETQNDINFDELRLEHKELYKENESKKFAGLTNFDDAQKIFSCLKQVKSNLAAASPLHYHTVSDYLPNKLKDIKRELKDLKKSYQNLKQQKENKDITNLLNNKKKESYLNDNTMIDKVNDYKIQMVKDIASDYHPNTKNDVIDKNMDLIDEKLSEIKSLEQKTKQGNELENLLLIYKSFLDDSLPTPLQINQDVNDSPPKKTDPKYYHTDIAKQYAGLGKDDEKLIEITNSIEQELQKIRIDTYAKGYNYVYQDGIILDNMEKKEENKEEAIFDYSKMALDEKALVIKELMELDNEYQTWLNDREDNKTKSNLYKNQSQYYYRLFTDPFDNFYLEKERQNLYNNDLQQQFKLFREKQMQKDPFSSHMVMLRKKQMDNAQHQFYNHADDDDDEYVHQNRLISKKKDDDDTAQFNNNQKIKEILSRYNQFDEQKPIAEQIDGLVNHNEKLSNMYQYATKQQAKYKNEKERLQNELFDMKKQNEDLKEEIELLQQNGTLNGDENDLDEKDIIQQLRNQLSQLHDELKQSNNSVQQDYKSSRSSLNNMSKMMNDLSKEFDSQQLYQANDILNKGKDELADIEHDLAEALQNPNVQLSNEYQRGPLLECIKDLIEETDTLLQFQPKKKPPKLQAQSQPGAEPIYGDEQDMYMEYPPIEYNNNNNEPNTKGLYEKEPYITPKENQLKFDQDFPMVTHIEIGGKWYNKYPICIIKYKYKNSIERKMSDFKWLRNALLLHSSPDKIVPDYPYDIPESHWPEGYLRRRKKELNLFLMHCHSINWIKNFYPYQKIFLAKTKTREEYKKLREDYDKKMIQTAKNDL